MGRFRRDLLGLTKLGGLSGCCLLLGGAREGQTLRERSEVFLPKAQHMIKEEVDIIGVLQGLWITGICSQGRHIASLL